MRQYIWQAAAVALLQTVAASTHGSTAGHARRTLPGSIEARSPLGPVVIPPIVDLPPITIGAGILSSDKCGAGETLAVVAKVDVAGLKICACVNVLGIKPTDKACDSCGAGIRSCGSAQCGDCTCSPDAYKVSGVCRCKSGYYQTSDGKCKPIPTCNAPATNAGQLATCTTRDDCKCTCPPGYASDANGVCKPTITCPDHSALTCGRSGCVCSCLPGFHSSVDGRACVKDPVCPLLTLPNCNAGVCTCDCILGTRFNSKKGFCVIDPICGLAPIICDVFGDNCACGPTPSARRMKRQQKPFTQCPGAELACPIGSSLSGGYECVDAASSLEHCGTCGNDCSALPYAQNTGCSNGKCVILSCTKGYRLLDNTCQQSSIWF